MNIVDRKAIARHLTDAKRVVVKVGSALLVDAEKGRLNRAWLESFAADVAALRRRGQEVILVSSGAIALGRRHLGLTSGKLKLEESQAAAAVGQIRLAHAYKELLDAHEITVAQILLTLGDTEQRRRYLNARGTLNTLLALGAVPVINENDTVATAEIRYGDNDRLAARVAQMTGADCLVLLSDIDGLYTANPLDDPQAAFIPRVLKITPEIEAMAGGVGSDMGSGGMHTKIAAAKIAVGAGCHLCIAKGAFQHPLKRIEEGARCTWFVPSSTPVATRKQWIAGTLKPAGAWQGAGGGGSGGDGGGGGGGGGAAATSGGRGAVGLPKLSCSPTPNTMSFGPFGTYATCCRNSQRYFASVRNCSRTEPVCGPSPVNAPTPASANQA